MADVCSDRHHRRGPPEFGWPPPASAVWGGPCYFVGTCRHGVKGSVPSRVPGNNHEGAVSVRLFIGNLPYSATEADLREHLSSVGAPAQVVLPTDRETGRPRGFAFVDYADRAVAEEAIRRFNQQPFKGRPLAVSEARPREDRPPGAPRPGGFGGSGPRPGAPGGFSAPRPPGPGGFTPRPADTGAGGGVPAAAGISGRTPRRRTSASRRGRTPTADRVGRSRSGRSAVSTTRTKTGEPKATRTSSTIWQRRRKTTTSSSTI